TPNYPDSDQESSEEAVPSALLSLSPSPARRLRRSLTWRLPHDLEFYSNTTIEIQGPWSPTLPSETPKAVLLQQISELSCQLQSVNKQRNRTPYETSPRSAHNLLSLSEAKVEELSRKLEQRQVDFGKELQLRSDDNLRRSKEIAKLQGDVEQLRVLNNALV